MAIAWNERRAQWNCTKCGEKVANDIPQGRFLHHECAKGQALTGIFPDPSHDPDNYFPEVDPEAKEFNYVKADWYRKPSEDNERNEFMKRASDSFAGRLIMQAMDAAERAWGWWTRLKNLGPRE